MKINLTDQELNEWLAIHICGFSIFRNGSERRYVEASPEKPFILEDSLLIVDQETKFLLQKSNSLFEREVFDPCDNLEHTYLIEEKIREVSRNWDKFCENLFKILFDLKSGDSILTPQVFESLHASARQRCEAAYWTF